MVLLEHGPGGQPALFDRPRRLVRADHAREVDAALDALDRERADGAWIAGFASYELGYALEPRLTPLMPPDRRLPLLVFGVFDAPGPADAFLAGAAREAAGARLAAARPGWDAVAHGRALRRILDYIAAGDIYQANLTMPMRAERRGSAPGLYAALRARQAVGHGAYVALPDVPVLVSRSPELFFSTDAEGGIETRPMKGTAPRASNPAHDAALRMELQQSAKNRAENLMIVDLLRNDISRICRPGTVRVPELYAIESYATVHQMVSRVTGQLLPGTAPSDILRALFPCGSITGAPKIRAMEIIRELELGPRGAYCGAVGWMAPDGASSFNVAIRTLTLYGEFEVEFGVGGGIVIDSTPEGEYEEALWKARFAELKPD
ncbi:Aminodeoxychorismate synthase component 1 [Defluviimonas aquaemixtae]|uniref:Aminodeoxychorismate synthase component 1 n=1 Tax=Albidovulum aquaemixtae TaxID=1542388 RepID=A0A2R8B7N1_9RHOB|nr:aminodeoxychorismate synthase component I [Defluviimonas aquaemixtae]SPH18533.1 Aminodeoxychorismate synthase component 1 [Defluviimonas aquaemixtae]